MKGHFEITGLGKCLVGTYTLRKLTKHFNCSPQQLLVIGFSGGSQMEFLSYLVKFSFENALIQAGGASALIDKSVDEIDIILDENPLIHDNEKVTQITDAIWLCVYGKTLTEYSKELEELEKTGDSLPQQVEEEKKSLTTSTTGGTLISTHGGQTSDPNNSTA